MRSNAGAAFKALLLALAAVPLAPKPALAWGDEGHEVIALVAAHYMRPEVLARVNALLATDADNQLTGHDIAAEATWADKFRDHVEGAKVHTGSWHFVDIELGSPDEAAACFGRPTLATGQPAYPGFARDCVVDKVDEFRRELEDPATASAERLLALKFLLHFVGDLHQPLHASDDHDRGGNGKALEPSIGRSRNLHAFWDTAVVLSLGHDPEMVASGLISRLTPAQVASWSGGTPSDWAEQSFTLAKADTYGKLPPAAPDGSYQLTEMYRHMAADDAAMQLSKAGVRLAALLDGVLSVRN